MNWAISSERFDIASIIGSIVKSFFVSLFCCSRDCFRLTIWLCVSMTGVTSAFSEVNLLSKDDRRSSMDLRVLSMGLTAEEVGSERKEVRGGNSEPGAGWADLRRAEASRELML